MAFVCDKSTIEGGDAGQFHLHLNVSFFQHSYVSLILLLRPLQKRFLGSLCKKKQLSTESSVHHTKTNLPTLCNLYKRLKEAYIYYCSNDDGLKRAVLSFEMWCEKHKDDNPQFAFNVYDISNGTDILITCPSFQRSQFCSVLLGIVSTDTIFLCQQQYQLCTLTSNSFKRHVDIREATTCSASRIHVRQICCLQVQTTVFCFGNRPSSLACKRGNQI